MAATAKVFKCLILGAPASGKGTVSGRIVSNFQLQHISSGDRLRAHIQQKTPIGEEVRKYTEQGRLVPDETITKFIVGEIQKHSGQSWLLDGFPRTLPQAQQLHRVQQIDVVINLDVPFDVIVDRVRNRWVHLPSGRVYNTDFNAPKVPGKDDVTGEPLVQRDDDKPETVQKRLNDYDTLTRPVIEFYRKQNSLYDFSGRTTNEIWPQILERLQKVLVAPT